MNHFCLLYVLRILRRPLSQSQCLCLRCRAPYDVCSCCSELLWSLTVLIASIVIGIAVDDTIHLLHHIRHHLDRGGTIEQALAHNLSLNAPDIEAFDALAFNRFDDELSA